MQSRAGTQPSSHLGAESVVHGSGARQAAGFTVRSVAQPNSHQPGARSMWTPIALLFGAFAFLGLVGVQTRNAVTTLEGGQHAQALMLANDMAERMNLNQANASSYVGSDIGVSAASACANAASLTAQKDLCEWSRLIQSAAETANSAHTVALLNARGCITRSTADQYRIAVAWQGIQASGAPMDTCGKEAFRSEDMRRVASVVVHAANAHMPAY